MESKYLDATVVSTDDCAIAKVAESAGAEVPFLRPSELAKDDTPSVDVIIHALHALPKYDIVVLLQPTSPFRTSLDIDNAIEKWAARKETVVSVSKVQKSPGWLFPLGPDQTFRYGEIAETVSEYRPKNNELYALNGAIYIIDVGKFLNDKSLLKGRLTAFEMSKLKSIDIDTEDDWQLAHFIAIGIQRAVDAV